MIVYKDVFAKLASCGWTIYRLTKEKKLGKATITNIKAGKAISTDTLDTICSLCKCQPGELIGYIEDAGET